jgi:hypothetical protein
MVIDFFPYKAYIGIYVIYAYYSQNQPEAPKTPLPVLRRTIYAYTAPSMVLYGQSQAELLARATDRSIRTAVQRIS